jgi:protein-tyrosine phosphatase
MLETQLDYPQILSLEGGHNFREVGGYPALSGTRLRRGLVWRSASLDRLSQVDCRKVRALGIRTIADLRTDAERERFPTTEDLACSVRILSWPSDDITWAAGNGLALRDLNLHELRAAIAQLYTRIVEAHARQFGAIIQLIADGEAPVLVHCTAGKDRTGLAIALLLELVGVPRGWILWDYEQTNRHLRQDLLNIASVAAVGGMAEWLDGLGPEARDLVLGVDRSYLVAALASMEARFGSVEAFAREGMALPAQTLQQLRERLLDAQ